VKKSLVEQQPEVVKKVYDLLRKGKTSTLPTSDPIETTPFGIEATRPALQLIIEYAHQQRIIPRRYSVDDIYGDAPRIVGWARHIPRASCPALARPSTPFFLRQRQNVD